MGKKYLYKDRFYFPVHIAQRRFGCRSSINTPVNAQFKFLQFVQCAHTLKNRPLLQAGIYLSTYLCQQQLECSKWNSGSASSQSARLHPMCSLVNQRLVSGTEKGRWRENLQLHRIYARLTAYTWGRITSSPLNWAGAELHHHLSEIFL